MTNEERDKKIARAREIEIDALRLHVPFRTANLIRKTIHEDCFSEPLDRWRIETNILRTFVTPGIADDVHRFIYRLTEPSTDTASGCLFHTLEHKDKHRLVTTKYTSDMGMKYWECTACATRLSDTEYFPIDPTGGHDP